MGVTYPNNIIRAFLSFFSLYLFNKSKIVRIKKLTAPVKGAVIDFFVWRSVSFGLVCMFLPCVRSVKGAYCQ